MISSSIHMSGHITTLHKTETIPKLVILILLFKLRVSTNMIQQNLHLCISKKTLNQGYSFVARWPNLARESLGIGQHIIDHNPLAQCPQESNVPSLPHQVSFPALAFRPYWCPSPFPSLSIIGVFHSLLSAIGFQSCFFFTADVSPSFRSTFHLLTFQVSFQARDWLWSRCCGPRGGQRCAWSRKLDPNFCSGRG